MSRVGKQEITIPEKTEVTVEGKSVTVKGPHGTLSRPLHSKVAVSVENGQVKVAPKEESIFGRSLWGTYASHLVNMIAGVNTPYEKKLIIEGVGYRAEMNGNNLKLMMGYSHPVIMEIPEGLKVSVEKNEITVSGIDKEAVGQFAANVRAVRKPEPYKGKGIRYSDEIIRRKQGKKAA